MRGIAGGSVGLEWRPGGQGFSQRLVVSSSTDCHPLAVMYRSSRSWLGGGDWIVLPLKEHRLIVVGGVVTLPLFTPPSPQERENLSLIMLYYMYLCSLPAELLTPIWSHSWVLHGSNLSLMFHCTVFKVIWSPSYHAGTHFALQSRNAVTTMFWPSEVFTNFPNIEVFNLHSGPG